MRNLTDDQAAEVAYDIIRDHLISGIEALTIAETLDDFDTDEQAQDDDIEAVDGFVSRILDKLIEALDNL